jgi:hypothetical protein
MVQDELALPKDEYVAVRIQNLKAECSIALGSSGTKLLI